MVVIGIIVTLLVVVCLDIPYRVDDVTAIDTLNYCGNVTNCNHTYLILTALIESEHQKEVVKGKFPDVYSVLPFEDAYLETDLNGQFSKYAIDDSIGYPTEICDFVLCDGSYYSLFTGLDTSKNFVEIC